MFFLCKNLEINKLKVKIKTKKDKNIHSIQEMTNKSEILYVKGMNLSETEDEEDEDIWDDRKLNDAYDKALRIANAEVAKRIAMSTNTKQNKDENASEPSPIRDTSKSKRNKPSGKAKSTNTKDKKTQWKAGMECRAVYDGDGLEYEAFVLRIINANECIVRFLGYNNSEIVDMSALKPSLGKEARDEQIKQALIDQAEDGDTETMEIGSDRLHSPSPSTDKMSQKKKKSNKKKKNTNPFPQLNGLGMPPLPMAMPNASFLKNLGSMEMPIPPPMFPTPSRVDSDDQALQSMLLSWYMSGYYTGLYQGLKRAKGNDKH